MIYISDWKETLVYLPDLLEYVPYLLMKKMLSSSQNMNRKKYMKSINMKISRMRISIQCYRLYIHITHTEEPLLDFINHILTRISLEVLLLEQLMKPIMTLAKNILFKDNLCNGWKKISWKMSTHSFDHPNGKWIFMWTKNVSSNRISIVETIHTYIPLSVPINWSNIARIWSRAVILSDDKRRNVRNIWK